MEVQGLFHIHSRYSYDGELSLKAIRRFALSQRCRFAVLGEHSQDFDRKRFQRYRANARKESKDGFLFLPGIEYEFGRVHLLGWGIGEYFASSGILECVKHIHEQNGLIIWVHPHRADIAGMEPYLSELDGMEVWSARYGCKYVPDPRLLRTLRRVRRSKSDFFAYAGLDAHKSKELCNLALKIDLRTLTEEEMLLSLSSGKFSLEKGGVKLGSDGIISVRRQLLYQSVMHGYKALEWWLDL